jgi:phosphate starvation-inducible PhoH-like protein
VAKKRFAPPYNEGFDEEDIAFSNGKTEYSKNFRELKKFLSKAELQKSPIKLTEKQELFSKTVRDNTITVCTGTYGTAKTFVSCWTALNLLAEGKVDKIILTKPIQESGENIGFLKGTLEEKIDPYVQSFKYTFLKMIPPQTYEFLVGQNYIEFKPIAYMLGATFDNCVMLLDEAQNLTAKQLMLWISRLGNNSKAIITGDAKQFYVKSTPNQFEQFIDSVLTGIDKIEVFRFTREDIVRNDILIKIAEKYEQFTEKTEKQNNRGNIG